MVNKALEKALDRIREVRPKAEGRLLGRQGIVGSMLGIKLVQGQLTAVPTLTLLVSEKLPPDQLSRRERIPRRMKVGSQFVTTDVIEVTKFVNQSVFPPTGALTTFDGTEYGTLTAFGRTQEGHLGVTCAHAIEGEDNNPYTRSKIGIWSPQLQSSVPVGFSTYAVAGGGSGIPGSYGFVDVATFSLENPDILARAAAAPVLQVASPVPGSDVRGAGNSGSKLGVIIGIEQRIGDVYVDVVVKVDAPGTFRGDSGMLWRDSAGRAVAVHAKGNSVGPGAGSSLSAAMRADRAVQALGVTFAGV